MSARTILLATANRAKQAKLRWLLDGLGFRLVTPSDVGISCDPPETGRSHGEIAADKAVAWSKRVPHLVVASDGGARIPALGDRWSSIRTRRAAGLDVTDCERADHLLGLMRGLTDAQREVIWVEAVAFARHGTLDIVFGAHGSLGRLAEAYDPAKIEGGFWMAGLIVVPRFGKLYRDLTPNELAQVDDAWNDLRRRVRAAFGAPPD